jgi:hypothetical protein
VPPQDEQRDSVVDTPKILDRLEQGGVNVAGQIPKDMYEASKGLFPTKRVIATVIIICSILPGDYFIEDYFNFNTHQELKKIKKEAKEIKEELKKTEEELKPADEKLCESLSIHSTDNDKLYHLYQPKLPRRMLGS